MGAEVVTGKHVLHASHALRVFRGLYYCNRCGYYASKAPTRLKLPCEGFGRTGRAVLARIHSGVLPPGLANWPDEEVGRAIAEHLDLEP